MRELLYGFTKVTLYPYTAKYGFRWFQCRHCNWVFIGQPIDRQPVWQENGAAQDHETHCELND